MAYVEREIVSNWRSKAVYFRFHKADFHAGMASFLSIRKPNSFWNKQTTRIFQTNDLPLTLRFIVFNNPGKWLHLLRVRSICTNTLQIRLARPKLWISYSVQGYFLTKVVYIVRMTWLWSVVNREIYDLNISLWVYKKRGRVKICDQSRC